LSGMRGYIIRRIGYMIVMMFALVTILFFMFRLLPGDPFAMFVDAALPVEAREHAMKQFGLDRPILVQYLTYMKNFLHGEFGMSFHYLRPVTEIIGEKFWNTVILMGAGLFLTFLIGIIGGAVMAWRRGSRLELFGIATTIFLRSAPTFWTGVMAIMLFSVRLKWFPLSGMRTPGQDLPTLWAKYFSPDFLHHLILPTLVLVAYDLATPLLVMRSSMLEVMKEDFIEMAFAKGLRERTVLMRHAVRNALLPIVTLFAIQAGFVIGGQVLVEQVFSWPGLGREIVLAIQRRDYPITQAAFFIMGVMVIVLNFLADLSYGYLDPRVVYDEKGV
jgi:peptide/nickel transport system permease protein